MNYTNFLAGYFATDRNVREIYRSALLTACEMVEFDKVYNDKGLKQIETNEITPLFTPSLKKGYDSDRTLSEGCNQLKEFKWR